MRPARAWLVYLAGVFVGGALIAPWLHALANWGAEQVPALEKLARQPFHRYLHRSLLVLALAGLWPLLRQLNIRSWAAAGMEFRRGRWKDLFSGFGTGFFSLAAIAACVLVFGAREMAWDRTASEWVRHLIGAGAAAAVVAFIEELLFRGALMGGLRQAHSWKTALCASSLVYALVHFFSKPPPPPEIGWATGFLMLPQMLSGFLEFPALVPGFFNLAVAGLILGLAYQFTGSLCWSVGLHAGWIFWLKFYGFMTRSAAESAFWGSGRLIDGWAALIALLAVLGFVWRRRTRNNTPESR